MEESSAPKPVLEFNFKAEVDNDIFNIILTQNYENCEHLIIKISQTNAIPPTSYEAKFTKKDLDTTSRYFKMFDDISQLFPEMQSKFEKKEYNIKKNQNAILIYFILGIKNIPDFSLTIPKTQNSINSTVEALCQLVNKMQNDNKKMKDEMNNILNDNKTMREDMNKILNENKKMKDEIKNLKEEIINLKKEVKFSNAENEIDSDIVKNKDEKKMVFNWIRQNAKMKFNLLFKATRDGDRISSFADKVKGKSPTLILIKTKTGYKFGGYTTVEWDMTGYYKYQKDENAFIFSINNKKKFNVIKRKENNAICGDPNHFAFGGGHNLTIWDNFFTNDNSKSYRYNHSYDTTSNYELTGGANKFYVEECEVYQVIFE